MAPTLAKGHSPGPPTWSVLHRLTTTIHGQPSVLGTVQAVVDIILAETAFEVAVVSVMRSDGGLETVAVAGSESAQRELLGARRPLSSYDEEFAAAESWGQLMFVPHNRLVSDDWGWVPDLPVPEDETAWHPMDALFAPLRSPGGELVGVLSVDLPRDGRRPDQAQRELLEVLAVQAGIAVDNARLTERLRLSEELFRMAFDGAGTGIAILGAKGENAGRYQNVNRTFLQILGRTADQVLDARPGDLTHPDDGDPSDPEDDGAPGAAGSARADFPDTVVETERRYLCGDGSTLWVSVTQTLVRSDQGEPLYVVHQIDDISRRKAQQDDLHHRAHHDALTDLPNRSSLWDRLVSSVETATSTGQDGLMLLVDLDQFKTINDRFGHLAGDRVLTVVAQRLQGAVRAADMVGRLGGDEFVVIADAMDDPMGMLMAYRIRQAVAAPITVDHVSVQVTASVGSAVISAGVSDPASLMRIADAAMYRDKGQLEGLS